MKKFLKYSIIILLSISVLSCVEPYSPKTAIFENVLVVNAQLTDVQGFQKVVLTRTSQLEMDTLITESNATVLIKDELNHSHSFSESDEPGVYYSDEKFKAIPDIAYTLHIVTLSGEKYESNKEKLTPKSLLKNLYAVVKTIKGETGVQIFVDSEEDVGEAKYFRYEFEETYKVITPYTINTDIELSNIYNNGVTYDLNTSQTTEEKRICYSKGTQTRILQVNTVEIENSGVSKFPVRFIPKNSHLIRERYSILVKQIVQSENSYNYYKTLSNLGTNESVLVSYQTGYVQSNIQSLSNIDEKVLGIFEVSSVSTKRIFFNYDDLGFEKPDYSYDCFTEVLDYRDNTGYDMDQDERAKIYYYLTKKPPAELLKIHWVIDSFGKYIPIYTFVNEECSNCTTFSSNLKPEFWED